MKHSTPDSMKFKKLQRRLGVSRATVAGTLELLWIATQKNAKRGDIGRYSSEEIAIECDWEGDHDDLVSALVDCGWLDESAEYRLVVHDWEEHAPRYIHAWIKSQSTEFATAGTTEATVEATIEATTEGGIRNVTKRNLTKPNERTLGASVRPLDSEEFENLKPRCSELKKAVDPNPRIELMPDDRELCVKAVALEHFGLVDLTPLIRSVKRKRPDSGTRWGYFRGALRNALEASGHNFHQQYNAVRIPEPPIPNGASP